MPFETLSRPSKSPRMTLLQEFPWRCSVCCEGFRERDSLASHFKTEEHINFSNDIYEFLTGEEAIFF